MLEKEEEAAEVSSQPLKPARLLLYGPGVRVRPPPACSEPLPTPVPQAGPDSDDDWQPPSSSSSTPAAPDGSASSPYFSSWDSPAAHLAYLQDQALVTAFRTAIKSNPALFAGKVVLDLGCGPGHLAMMCVQAGASRVYAVDGSQGAAATAEQVVQANGMSDKVCAQPSPGP